MEQSGERREERFDKGGHEDMIENSCRPVI